MISLKKLGLRYQLGHRSETTCIFSTRGSNEFVVLHVNGTHIVNVVFCGCNGAPTHRKQLLEVGWWPSTLLESQTAATMSLLWSFHIWNLQGQISPTDFYYGLKQMTSGEGLEDIPASCLWPLTRDITVLISFKDRLAQWMLMVREWRHIKMAKRSGRGHDPSGIGGTCQGGFAIPCRSCPHPDINLPTDWTNVPRDS